MDERQELWLAQQLLEGAPIEAIEQAMVQGGLKVAEAHDRIEAVLTSPVFKAARPKIQLGQRLAMAAELNQSVCVNSGPVPRHKNLDAEDFYTRWLKHHQPVVLEGFAANWPACSWTLEHIAQCLGDKPVEILSGRLNVDHPDRDFQKIKTELTPASWVQLIREKSPTNDFYMVARNHLMQRPQAQALLEDTPIEESWVDRSTVQECCSLWMGPAGTQTALHHDTCHALFVQLVGRKRFRLASPLIPDLLLALDGYYQRQRSLQDLCEKNEYFETDLGPGDALFLPVGWWHETEALSISVGMSFNGLHAPNHYPNYGPGFL